MKQGKVGTTASGFRSITVLAHKGKEFVGIEAESGRETASDSAVLSGHAVDRPPRNWTLDTPQVSRIRRGDIDGWLKSIGEDGELVVGEGVVVDLGDDNYITGPNGGLLYERPKSP